jgi:hypothetical protein
MVEKEMINRHGLMLAFLGVMATNATAAVLVEFRGEFKVTAQSQICTDISGDLTAVTFKMRLMMPNLGDNDSRTSMSLIIDGIGAANYTLPSGNLFGTTFKSINYSNVYRYAGTTPGASKVRFTVQRPQTLTIGTQDIRIKGDIKNFDGDVGCNVSFSATGFRQ